MYTETETKRPPARVAVFLLCALAVCCSVMYLSADGNEYIHEDPGLAVESMDTLKAGDIYTETPRGGRDRLMDYFTHVENEISTEVAERKADIASVRAQMAKDLAYNMGARAKLKKEMLHKMAQNAKIARDDLMHFMRKTQERFAKQAHLANRRYKATLRRDKKTKALIDHDKREQAHNLKLAVTSWQRSTAAWAAHTNARIDRLNKHVAANAAQIEENAKKARKDLDVTMASWDHSVNNFKESSSRARSKLKQQFAAQSKATRNWASNQIKMLVASTAAQFNDVEIKMAKNRHEVDMAVRQATMRFEATLNSAKALEDKRYASTVADIAALKKETAAKVDAAATQFKVSLLSLSSEVKHQVQKVNKRIDDTAGVIRSDAAKQAKVNANVNAEMARMIKLGNDRYKKHLEKDAELQKLIAKDKSETDEKLNKMAADFNNELSKVRKDLAKNRKHAEDELKKATGGVYDQLMKDQEEQKAKNAEMTEAVRRMRLDAMDAVRHAKEEFQEKIKDLGVVVKKNDEKADAKIKKLAGVVQDNAAKSAQGRQVLYDLEEANKKELKASIEKAIDDGEKRALAVEEKGKKMDAETKFKIKNRLSAEIKKLRDETNGSVEALALQSKEAREEMKKEMLYAIRSAAEVAKDDLDLAIQDAADKTKAYVKKSYDIHTKNQAEREALTDEIAANAKEVQRMLKDAVATDAKAQAALAQETAEAIKKTNTDVAAYAKQMEKLAKESRDGIKLQAKKMVTKIEKQEEKLKKKAKKLTDKDKQRQEKVLTVLKRELENASKQSEQKFGKAFEKLSQDRAHADQELSTAIHNLNDSLAKQAALEDIRFKKTVTDINAARKQAAEQVGSFRKEFAMEMLKTTAMAKNVESKLTGLIEVVSGEVISLKAHQVRVNRRVKRELKRIEKLSNDEHTDSKTARGQLRRLMDENKRAAADEIAALTKKIDGQITKYRAHNAHNKREMAKDLTTAAEKFYEKAAAQQKANTIATEHLNGQTQKAVLAAESALKKAGEFFDSKIVMLANTVTSNAVHAENEIERVTGVAHDVAKAAEGERKLIKDSIIALEADLNKALSRAISIGEAKAKAVEQRIAEHLKGVKRFLQVELSETTEEAADKVLKMIEGKRQAIADNYLSLKAYAVAGSDAIQEYVTKGQGKGLSSIGSLLTIIGGLGPVRAPDREGMGMGGEELPTIFSGETINVKNVVSVVNGLVDEFSDAAGQVRMMWPMGLGKYLLDKLEISMLKKGVLQVDKINGKAGNYVFVNGRSIGLSNKMKDFTKLAVRMATYEGVLAKLTAKIVLPKVVHHQVYSAPTGLMEGPNAWNGDR